jgi:hypothetical protein
MILGSGLRLIVIMTIAPSVAYAFTPIAFFLILREDAMHLNGNIAFLLLWLISLVLYFAAVIYTQFYCQKRGIGGYVIAFACLILTFMLLYDQKLIHLAAPCDVVPFLILLLFAGAILAGLIINLLIRVKKLIDQKRN